jgi:hypothetical protein
MSWKKYQVNKLSMQSLKESDKMSLETLLAIYKKPF